MWKEETAAETKQRRKAPGNLKSGERPAYGAVAEPVGRQATRRGGCEGLRACVRVGGCGCVWEAAAVAGTLGTLGRWGHYGVGTVTLGTLGNAVHSLRDGHTVGDGHTCWHTHRLTGTRCQRESERASDMARPTPSHPLPRPPAPAHDSRRRDDERGAGRGGGGAYYRFRKSLELGRLPATGQRMGRWGPGLCSSAASRCHASPGHRQDATSRPPYRVRRTAWLAWGGRTRRARRGTVPDEPGGGSVARMNYRMF